MNDFTLKRLEKSYPFLYREADDIKELNSEEIVIKTIHNDFYIFNENENTILRAPINEDPEEYIFRRQFGKGIRRMMSIRGLTQRDLSELTGLSQPQLSGYMNGRNLPSPYVLEKLAKVLKCKVDDFYFYYQI